MSKEKQKIILQLELIADNLEKRSLNCFEFSQQTGSGFPSDYYIENKGMSFGFSCSAGEIRSFIDLLLH